MQFVESIFFAMSSIALMLFIFKIVEKFLSIYTEIKVERISDAYQGGEFIKIKENRYASAIFPYTMYFLILHVLGFLAATIFTLIGEDPINWVTVFFGSLMLYTVLLIRKGVSQI